MRASLTHDELFRSAVPHVRGISQGRALSVAHAHLENPTCEGTGIGIGTRGRHGIHGLLVLDTGAGEERGGSGDSEQAC